MPNPAPVSARPTVLRTVYPQEGPGLAVRTFGPAGVSRYLNAGLIRETDRYTVEPHVATGLPTQEAGTWTINPDGTMRTIWTLRSDVRWHDGQPLTAHDVAFAYQVYTDRGVTIMETASPENLMSGVVARDDRTIEVNWKQLYYRAGQPTSGDLAPLPRHRLEELFNSGDRQAFNNSTFWGSAEEYIGVGPYRMSKREPGISITLSANPDFFLGKPRIDMVEMTHTADTNAAVARLLAGDIDFAEHRLILVEQAMILQEQWKSTNGGRIFTTPTETVVMGFQQRDVPGHQGALKDRRVRQALTHAIDRDALAGVGMAGFGTTADTNVFREQSIFARADSAVTKYPYDIRRTEQLLNEAGWTKSSDGLFRGTAGQTLDIEMNVSDIFQQLAAIVADDWKRAGFDSRFHVITAAERDDRYLRTHFTGTNMESFAPYTYHAISRAELPTEENQWRGRNRTSWVNSDFEAAYSRFNEAMRESERDEMTIQLERVITGDAGQPRLFYQVRFGAARSGVEGMKALVDSTHAYNIYEWTIRQ